MDSITATILILFGVAAGCIVALSLVTYPPGDRISGPTSLDSSGVVLGPVSPARAAHDALSMPGRSHIDVVVDLQATGVVMHEPTSLPPNGPFPLWQIVFILPLFNC